MVCCFQSSIIIITAINSIQNLHATSFLTLIWIKLEIIAGEMNCCSFPPFMMFNKVAAVAYSGSGTRGQTNSLRVLSVLSPKIFHRAEFFSKEFVCLCVGGEHTFVEHEHTDTQTSRFMYR